MARVPDLLHPTPICRIDAEHTKLSIALAFASGVSGGLFADALDRASVTPSTWEPASFAHDLFLQSFVTACFKVRIAGDDRLLSTNHIVKLLAYPPSDPRVVHHRRAIVAELAEAPALRASLERLYASLCRFRTLLEGATGIGKWDTNRRQLDILVVIKEIIDGLVKGSSPRAPGWRGSASSGSAYRRVSRIAHSPICSATTNDSRR